MAVLNEAKERYYDNIFWSLALLGLIALYGPTYFNAWKSIWQTEEHGHGPIIIAVLVWLGWQVSIKIRNLAKSPNFLIGFGVLIIGLIGFAGGKIFSISSLEFSSHLFVIPGILIIARGFLSVKLAWFPILYMIFIIPLPASFIDAVTQPLKMWISFLSVEILGAAGYPIARSGVIISIGQYQLLVADACSGLHSMFSLAALGVLFMYISNRKSLLHNIIMISSIAPIAFLSNIFRVIILILVTYHLGDELAQSFLHGAAGMVLMLLALFFLFFLDIILASVISRKYINTI